MDLRMNQLELSLCLNLLGDGLKQKEESVEQLKHSFEGIRWHSSHHTTLISGSRQIIHQVADHIEQTRDLFTDAKMDAIHSFFAHSFSLMRSIAHQLAETLEARVNQSIELASRRPVLQTCEVKAKRKGAKVEAFMDRDEARRATRNIGKELQSIDYFLQMLTQQDSKDYEERQRQYEKLVSQRRSLESIHPSEAHRHIKETANIFETALEANEKLYQESYLLNYMEFKTHISNIEDSSDIIESFRKELQSSTKDKFLQGLLRVADRLLNLHQKHRRRHLVPVAVQTEDFPKSRMQDKLQNLLISEKKTNDKLQGEIKALKKSIANFNADKSEGLKKLETEQDRNKELLNKYSILEHLYNEKSYLLSKALLDNKKSKNSLGIQTTNPALPRNPPTESGVQTDSHFYYHFERVCFEEQEQKIEELQKIIKHKDYVIKEMEAVRTFRDNFKSRKQIFSAVLRPRKPNQAKSLHYLQEESSRKDEEDFLKSGSSSTKRMVTFRETRFEDDGTFCLRKKKKKTTRSGTKIRTHHYDFSDEVKIDHDSNLACSFKSHAERPHEISLKSILKVGSSGHPKQNQGTQTETEIKDEKRKCVQGMGQKQILNSNDNNHSILKQRAGPSLTASKRQSQSKGELRKSKILVNEQEERRIPSVQRVSESYSPQNKNWKDEKGRLVMRSKFMENRVNTAGNEMLHVNNTLNMNLMEAFSSMPNKTAKISQLREGRQPNLPKTISTRPGKPKPLKK